MSEDQGGSNKHRALSTTVQVALVTVAMWLFLDHFKVIDPPPNVRDGMALVAGGFVGWWYSVWVPVFDALFAKLMRALGLELPKD